MLRPSPYQTEGDRHVAGRLEGKVALVTGAGGGIGRAIVQAFAAEGARVGVVDRDEKASEETCEGIGAAAVPFPADVSSLDSITQLMQSVERRFEALHVLVNNAGIAPRKRFETLQPAEWHEVWATNLEGAVSCTRAALPLLRRGAPASIINIASIMIGYHSTRYSAYATSKGALASLSRSLALEVARDGIRVNYVCPGFIRTEMTRRYWSRWLFRRYLKLRTPMGRAGEPEEVASVAVFLASADSIFVTGQGITVDGGLTLQVL